MDRTQYKALARAHREYRAHRRGLEYADSPGWAMQQDRRVPPPPLPTIPQSEIGKLLQRQAQRRRETENWLRVKRANAEREALIDTVRLRYLPDPDRYMAGNAHFDRVWWDQILGWLRAGKTPEEIAEMYGLQERGDGAAQA